MAVVEGSSRRYAHPSLVLHSGSPDGHSRSLRIIHGEGDPRINPRSGNEESLSERRERPTRWQWLKVDVRAGAYHSLGRSPGSPVVVTE